MFLMQLSSGQGPIESCRAVSLAAQLIIKEAQKLKLGITELERTNAEHRGCARSVLLLLEGTQTNELLKNWLGTLQWRCQSPYRPKHKRKNWFFDCCVYAVETHSADYQHWLKTIEYRTCRASGAGGQHVNTTDSAVQAFDPQLKLMVKVASERSQHANKRAAQILLWQKRQQWFEQQQKSAQQQRWYQHWQLERGNATHVFEGIDFKRINL